MNFQRHFQVTFGRISMLFLALLVCYLMVKFNECGNINRQLQKNCEIIKTKWRQSEIQLKNLENSLKENQKLAANLQELKVNNVKLTEINRNLLKEFEISKLATKFPPNNLEEMPSKPSEAYEMHRRRLQRTIPALWGFTRYRLEQLKVKFADNDTKVEIDDVIRNVYEHKIFLLSEFEQMSRADGYDNWRSKELQALERIVQQKIDAIQNPPDCAQTKKIKCYADVSNCGFGCQVQHVTDCLTMALGMERTMVFDSRGFNYAPRGFQEVFQPFSRNCTEVGEGEAEESYPASGNYSQVKNLVIGWPSDLLHVEPRPKFIPAAVPAGLMPRLRGLVGNPTAWWLGQVKKYFLTRLLPESRKNISERINALKFHNQSPIVGVHVRRSDKLPEADAFPLSVYMQKVDEYYDHVELTRKIAKRRIFLATEIPEVIAEAKSNYPHYEILVNEEGARQAFQHATRYTVDGLYGILMDIQLLSQCDYLVCTMSSNVCRIAFELMQTVKFDSARNFQTVDNRYENYNQRPQRGTVLMAHHAANIQMQIDSTIIIYSYGYGNGQIFVKNNETSQSHVVPEFKLEDGVDEVEFPLFSTV